MKEGWFTRRVVFGNGAGDLIEGLLAVGGC